MVAGGAKYFELPTPMVKHLEVIGNRGEDDDRRTIVVVTNGAGNDLGDRVRQKLLRRVPRSG